MVGLLDNPDRVRMRLVGRPLARGRPPGRPGRTQEKAGPGGPARTRASAPHLVEYRQRYNAGSDKLTENAPLGYPRGESFEQIMGGHRIHTAWLSNSSGFHG